MDVRCEQCKTEYEFDDSRVTASGVSVKCTTCGHVFTVSRPQTPAGRTLQFAPSHEVDAAREWRVRLRNGSVLTAHELTTMQQWVVEQRIIGSDEVSINGDAWKPAQSLPSLQPFFDVVSRAQVASEYEALVHHSSSKGTPTPPTSGPNAATRPGRPPPTPDAAATQPFKLNPQDLESRSAKPGPPLPPGITEPPQASGFGRKVPSPSPHGAGSLGAFGTLRPGPAHPVPTPPLRPLTPSPTFPTRPHLHGDIRPSEGVGTPRPFGPSLNISDLNPALPPPPLKGGTGSRVHGDAFDTRADRQEPSGRGKMVLLFGALGILVLICLGAALKGWPYVEDRLHLNRAAAILKVHKPAPPESSGQLPTTLTVTDERIAAIAAEADARVRSGESLPGEASAHPAAAPGSVPASSPVSPLPSAPTAARVASSAAPADTEATAPGPAKAVHEGSGRTDLAGPASGTPPPETASSRVGAAPAPAPSKEVASSTPSAPASVSSGTAETTPPEEPTPVAKLSDATEPPSASEGASASPQSAPSETTPAPPIPVPSAPLAKPGSRRGSKAQNAKAVEAAFDTKPGPDRHSFDEYMAQGDELREKEHPRSALAAYARAAALAPNRAEPVAGAGLAQLDLGKRQDAAKSFESALELNPSYGVALMGLAETYRVLGRKDDAVKYYEKYLDVLPDGSEAAVARKAIEQLKE